MNKVIRCGIVIFIALFLSACTNENDLPNTMGNPIANSIEETESLSIGSHPSKGLEFDLGTASYDYKGPHYFVSGIGTCTNKDIVIPSTYNNLPVTGIQASAFEECTTLKSVVIEEGVMSIGWSSFNKCTSLTKVVIPNSVIRISDAAFLYCINLKSITLPNSLCEINYAAFAECSSLTTIKFNGTMAQWNNIILGEDWNANVPATKVTCTDGEIYF